MAIIDTNEIWDKANEEKFEDLIKQYKKLSPEDLVAAGTNALIAAVNTITELWPNNIMDAFLLFIRHSIGISCTGIKTMTERKKDVIVSFFQPLGDDFVSSLRNNDSYFPPDDYDDEESHQMVTFFLSPCDDPFFSDYPFRYYQFIMACAVADSVNEAGLDKLRSIRKEYINYTLNKK